MRSKAVERILHAALEVIHQRRLAARLVFIDHLLIKNRPVAGFLQIGCHSEHQPEGIVVEPAADRVVAAFGQRLVLVVCTAVFQLCRREVEDPLACPLRYHVHKAQQILGRVTEPHAAPNTRLEIGCRARHVKGDHVLVRVPDVDHAIGVDVGRFDRKTVEQAIPAIIQFGKRIGHGIEIEIALDDRFDRAFVDRLRARRIELLGHRILVVAEGEDDGMRRAGLQADPNVMRADGLPAMSYRVGRLAALDGQWAVPAAVWSQERVTLRVKAGEEGSRVAIFRKRWQLFRRQLCRAGKPGEVVAALTILCLVIDNAVLHLDLGRVEVALEVGLIIPGIPQTEFDRREDRQIGRRTAAVCHRQAPDLQVLARRDEVQSLGSNAIALRRDLGIPDPMAAGVVFEISARRLP